MPRVAIPVTEVNRVGVAPPAEVTADNVNDHFVSSNDGYIFLEIRNNSGAAARDAIILTPGSVLGLGVADLTITVPLSATRLVGPFPPTVFNQDDASIYIDVAETDLRFRAYRVK